MNGDRIKLSKEERHTIFLALQGHIATLSCGPRRESGNLYEPAHSLVYRMRQLLDLFAEPLGEVEDDRRKGDAPQAEPDQ